MAEELTPTPASARHLTEVRRIVLAGLRGYRARLYLFGSWAKGTASRNSDIDVAVWPEEPIPRHVLSAIREALDESRVLYPVDLVDLSEAPARLRERVMREGRPWND
ncbi:MAG: nucleotidyltransferase domain-containing protein [Acidobacteria bacterium]|nr:nucleotidyltransferase domain-containing protein [Acidobacteriota bacterium]